MNSLEQSSPARLFATLAGGFLVVLGIVGFFYNASFDSGKGLRADDVLGILAVNGWDNLFHITTGLLGLACAGYAARQYSLGIGLIYVIVAIWGFADSHHGHAALLDLLPVNTADNFLHLIIGLAGLGAGAATLEAGRSKASASRRSTTTEAVKTTQSKPKAAAKKPTSTVKKKTTSTSKPRSNDTSDKPSSRRSKRPES